jgi:hypothetical protein
VSTLIPRSKQSEWTIDEKIKGTEKVGVYKCSLPRIPRFFLVDTPGFDDSDRSDAEVLKELAKHLAAAYSSKIKLTGLIYLHRIMDTRFGGASGRNLRTFKKLTGKDNLGSVVLATTFWKKPLSSDDVAKETQLNTDPRFGWATMLDEGATSMRQDGSADSGAAIIRHLVDQKREVSLQIQTEMVDQGKTIAETEAGSEVISVMYKKHEEAMAKLREDFEEALKDRDKTWQKRIEEEQVHRQYLFDRAGRGLRERLVDWWDDADCVVM